MWLIPSGPVSLFTLSFARILWTFDTWMLKKDSFLLARCSRRGAGVLGSIFFFFSPKCRARVSSFSLLLMAVDPSLQGMNCLQDSYFAFAALRLWWQYQGGSWGFWTELRWGTYFFWMSRNLSVFTWSAILLCSSMSQSVFYRFASAVYQLVLSHSQRSSHVCYPQPRQWQSESEQRCGQRFHLCWEVYS